MFNGVRGSRRHRASGALDPVKLSSPLLHGVGPSARSACAAARSQQHRRRAQPVDSTPAQDCEARRLCHACPAAASLMYLGSSSSQRLARGVLRRRKGARAAANSVRGSGALMSMLCRCFAHDLWTALLVGCARDLLRNIQSNHGVCNNDRNHKRFYLQRSSLKTV